MNLTSFQITRWFFLLTAAVLATFGIGSLLRMEAQPENAFLYVSYAILMFGDAVAMAFCAWQFPKRTKFIFYFSILALALNIFLTIFDQFGWVDLLFVLLNIAALVFLVFARREFLRV